MFKRICGTKLPLQPRRFTLTQDVQTENDITDNVIREQHVNNYAIVTSNLEKSYLSFEAVRGVSFAIKRGTYIVLVQLYI